MIHKCVCIRTNQCIDDKPYELTTSWAIRWNHDRCQCMIWDIACMATLLNALLECARRQWHFKGCIYWGCIADRWPSVGLHSLSTYIMSVMDVWSVHVACVYANVSESSHWLLPSAYNDIAVYHVFTDSCWAQHLKCCMWKFDGMHETYTEMS